MSNAASLAIWGISAATIAAILFRPAKIGEWIWAVAGAAAIVAAGLLPGVQAARAAADGLDVYCFLAGMIGLAELARVQGVFDWLAGTLLSFAPQANAGWAFRRVFGAAVIVTALLSNDGTIVLLTPAAIALAERGGIEVLPLAYACAFVANAASFILPLGNPANLVVFKTLPPLGQWLAIFALPSAAAVACCYIALSTIFGRTLRVRLRACAPVQPLSGAAKVASVAVLVSVALLVDAAAVRWPIGRTALFCALGSGALVATVDRGTPARILREGPWSIVPLVAGLFVIVRALDTTGVLGYARAFFAYAASLPQLAGNLVAGWAVAGADAVLNNLPVGVIARYSVHGASVPPAIVHAALVGVDLGPNLSLSGSLATLLWLMMLRRSGVIVTPLQFLKNGVLLTVPALAFALLCVR